MNVRATALALATALTSVLSAAPARAQTYTLTPIDFNLPSGYSLDSVGQINDNGLVAGTAVTTTSGGKTTKLGFVQAASGGPLGYYQTPGYYITSLRGINNTGYMSGYYEFSTFSGVGPPPAPGPFPLIVFNGQGTTPSIGDSAMGINNNNTVTGPVTMPDGSHYIYLADYPSGGRYTVSSPAGSQYPVTAMAINDSSTVVGTYSDASKNTIPYIRDASTNTWYSLSQSITGLALSPSGINNASVIAGGFTQNGTTGLFILNYPTGIHYVLYPGLNTVSIQATGINNSGLVVGVLLDTNGVKHAFLLTPQSGGVSAEVAPTAGAGGKSYTLKPASTSGLRTKYILPQIDFNERRSLVPARAPELDTRKPGPAPSSPSRVR